MPQPLIDESTYREERRLVDLDSAWAEQFRKPNGWTVIPADAERPAEIAGVDNAMRGRVEQFELLTDTPERFAAYIGSDGRSVTVWTGLPIGWAEVTSKWRVRGSYVGTHMHQYLVRIGNREFTGRSFGAGMCISLRETAESKRQRESAK